MNDIATEYGLSRSGNGNGNAHAGKSPSERAWDTARLKAREQGQTVRDEEIRCITQLISATMLINRKDTRRLLRVLDGLEPGVHGREVLVEQLRSVLARRDWLSISVEFDYSLARQFGGRIGIVQYRPPFPDNSTHQQKGEI